jgi:hypothetical protein
MRYSCLQAEATATSISSKIENWKKSADQIVRNTHELVRSMSTINLWEMDYVSLQSMLVEIPYLRKVDMRTRHKKVSDKTEEKPPITAEAMYEPISYLRRKFRYAFIQEIVLNMKNMLDMGRLVFPMENTFIIVVIRVYDDTANPSVSSTLKLVTFMKFVMFY